MRQGQRRWDKGYKSSEGVQLSCARSLANDIHARPAWIIKLAQPQRRETPTTDPAPVPSPYPLSHHYCCPKACPRAQSTLPLGVRIAYLDFRRSSWAH